MSEITKTPLGASPVARTGGGDISERELSQERYALQTTPPARSQPVHPKKQLFSAPVNKFTATPPTASANVARLRSCLREYARADVTPARPARKIGPKAVSMEDLTPVKRIRKQKADKAAFATLHSPLCSPLRSSEEQIAAARIGRFMLAQAWRRRRAEVHCLRKTLQHQVSCSERLRIQVSALKSLLDSDNMKVRLAMKELERLKQLLRDKELERQVLDREKKALEGDVIAAEDRASEMSIGWRNCRNELEGVRAAGAVCEHALSLERAAAAQARAQRDHAYTRLSSIEEELAQHEELLSTAEAQVSALRHDSEEKQRSLDRTTQQMKLEKEARERCGRECSVLALRVTIAGKETEELRAIVSDLQTQLAKLAQELAATREQLDWWPRPLTKMLGAARCWIRNPSVGQAVILSLVPARSGC